MPKARSIREGFDDDQRIALLSCGAELLFRKMIHKADDHGRVQAHPTTLLRWYAGKPDQPPEEALAAALDELEDLAVIRRYVRGGLSYALIPGWFDKGCPWYQHLSKRAEPLYPGPDDPEDPQTELPLGQQGARRERREDRDRGEARDEGRAAAPGREAAGHAGEPVPAGGGAGAERDAAGGGGHDHGRGADAGPRRGDPAVDAAAAAPGQGDRGVPGQSRQLPRDVAPAAGAEPAPGTVAQEEGLERPRPVMGRADAGSSPVGSTTPPAAVDATSSATRAAAAGGLPAPEALRIFAKEAGDRWAPGRAALTATGLPHRHEADWLRLWTEARGAGYGEAELRQLGRALREGRLWRNRPPLSPGKLVEHFFDLMAEATAPGGSGPSRRENGFDQLLREEREADVIEVSVDE